MLSLDTQQRVGKPQRALRVPGLFFLQYRGYGRGLRWRHQRAYGKNPYQSSPAGLSRLSHENISAIVVGGTRSPLIVEKICSSALIGVEAVVGVECRRQIEHLAADVVHARLAVGHEKHRGEAKFAPRPVGRGEPA